MAASSGPRIPPGLAVAIPVGDKFAVGLVTHSIPRQGEFTWISEDLFDRFPNLPIAAQITRWRWPVFMLMKEILQRHIFEAIGEVSIPQELQSLPLLRSKHPVNGDWVKVEITPNTGRTRLMGVTTDRTIPPHGIVNDSGVIGRIVSGWTPAQRW